MAVQGIWLSFLCQLYFDGLSDFLNSLFLKIICVCIYVHKYVSCSMYVDVRRQLVDIGPLAFCHVGAGN